jgi:hypothetical protein
MVLSGIVVLLSVLSVNCSWPNSLPVILGGRAHHSVVPATSAITIASGASGTP